MSRITIVFRNAATAEYRVAGVPAAARAAQAVARAFHGRDVRCAIVADRGWNPGLACRQECARLAPDLHLALAGQEAGDLAQATIRLGGEALVCTLAKMPDNDRSPQAAVETATMALSGGDVGPGEQIAVLRRAGRAIVAATGKQSDGIVSRFVNRPISQRISRILLLVPGIAPLHATMGAALLGILMALCLVLGGETGLILGAVLFQAASIVDGVDGEIARATCRTSDRGAMLDSLVDALTNLAFITGVTLNLGMAGDLSAGAAGGAGLVMLATGLFLIGRRAKASGQPVNFDVIKVHFRKRRSAVMQWLIWFTMRDFFAAAGALLILVGLTRQALFAFAIVAAGWLIVTVTVLVRTGGWRYRSWAGDRERRYTGRYST